MGIFHDPVNGLALVRYAPLRFYLPGILNMGLGSAFPTHACQVSALPSLKTDYQRNSTLFLKAVLLLPSRAHPCRSPVDIRDV